VPVGSPQPSLSRRRRRAFIAGALLLAVVGPVAVLLAMDAFLHTRFQRTGGVNIWGYRGPTVRAKPPGERRVVMLGGSSAFGYGVGWNQAIPARIESRLRDGGTQVSVVNLGYNNEGAYSFRPTMADYLYLDYDTVILYEGYNDLMGDPRAPNMSVFRHDSPMFRLTGYLPILPLVFKEKAASLLYRGDIGQLYEESRTGKKAVFDASLADRTKAGALNATAAVGAALERQLGKISPERGPSIPTPEASGCRSPWAEYCQSVFTAVEFGLQHQKQVIVVTQPYLLGQSGVRHKDQQQELKEMLRRRFSGDRRVLYLDAGPIVDLSDPAISFDHMHLTVLGNDRVAAALVEPVRSFLAQR